MTPVVLLERTKKIIPPPPVPVNNSNNSGIQDDDDDDPFLEILNEMDKDILTFNYSEMSPTDGEFVIDKNQIFGPPSSSNETSSVLSEDPNRVENINLNRKEICANHDSNIDEENSSDVEFNNCETGDSSPDTFLPVITNVTSQKYMEEPDEVETDRDPLSINFESITVKTELDLTTSDPEDIDQDMDIISEYPDEDNVSNFQWEKLPLPKLNVTRNIWKIGNGNEAKKEKSPTNKSNYQIISTKSTIPEVGETVSKRQYIKSMVRTLFLQIQLGMY